MAQNGRRYFIVKHGLDALEAMPGHIWRTDLDEAHPPRMFNRVREGDCWVGFAYTTSDRRERPLSLITGFRECMRTMHYGDIPAKGLAVADGAAKAWMIEGRPFGYQPRKAVGVPPIAQIIGRGLFNQATLNEIDAVEFAKLQECARLREFDTDTIPLLKREPRNEQELLAVVVACHEMLGIERILRVRAAFPDMLVKLAGRRDTVHLELELYSQSFRLHGHDPNDHKCTDGLPVAVLCWIDDDRSIQNCVHRVYELQSLLREKKRIQW